jgi:mycothiol synthase
VPVSVSTASSLGPDDRAAVHALADRLSEVAGAPALSDQALTQLAGSDVRHLLARDGAALVGYAQLAGAALEVAAEARAMDAVLTAAEDATSGELLVWTHGTHSPLGAAVTARNYEPVRVLHQLRRPAGVAVADRALPADVQVRPFRVGTDEDAWLRVNAAAFAEHAEQGGWGPADLQARENEAWFDPAGFFLAWRGDELVGFHWTKVHADGLGEVYVLGVAPGGQGSGLGAALLVIGLRHLADRGCPQVLLYVDETNAAAMRLYERYGFARHDVDRQWRAPR